ncbi:GGDEF domain-containing protein [Rhizobium sp. Td3]|nr:GGDEF domain-containing protein [Rhizobium sp. Td3]
MRDIWKKVLLRSFVAALVSIAASLAICFTIVPITGGSLDGVGLIMATVCPLVIAWPASALQFYQYERLRETRLALAESHRKLETMHGELKQAHEALAFTASRDAMTGALNRENFMLALKDARCRTGTVLFIDADHFKTINDTFGHLTGDEALKSIADRINACIRGEDFFGRLGGEEFAVFLHGVHENHKVLAIAQRICDEVSAVEMMTADGAVVPLSISIGTASFTRSRDMDRLCKEADNQLYEAKRRGRNRVVVGGNIDVGVANAEITSADLAPGA